MKLSEVQKILDAVILCGDDLLHKDVHTCFACDLISEMLLYVTPKTLVITSLTNIHVVHTAHVMDAVAVVFVGGKKPDSTVIANSEMSDIPLLTTNHLIFECCGRLYAKGIKGNKQTMDVTDVSG
jgi:predicted transcriptional regulator